jgi:hypothetical protein
MTRGLGLTRHASWSRAEGDKPPRAGHATAQRLQAFLHFRPDQRVKGWTAVQSACNRAKWAHPFDSNAPSMEAQAHTSCNRRAGCYVRATAPPLTPLPRLLDCRTSSAIRGNPVHDPTVPARRIGHGPVSRGRRRDRRCGHKWADSDGGSRGRKQQSCRQPSSRPLVGQRENPLPRREDGTSVFYSSNGSRRPIWAGARGDNLLVGPGTPRAQRLPREPLVPSH